ncbi:MULTISPECIES: hypothetical protein [Streptomyces]|uniref:Universal stress protein n=1 Tax=Streptomyces atrovirens TaxID=285556 RepID=A0ABW0E2M5_9ACTN|nr:MULTISPECIES: hypothetical protein [unclassified Streptomyces]AZM64514.1 hypothetical protein DLM49_11415 [Streptomyces sp. WAC 01438]RSM99929.1 hypothetical protein DMA10_06420 [Streptomyces sp. WAC 01420]
MTTTGDGTTGDDGTTGGNIAVVGHADLTPDTLLLVESALRARLARRPAPAVAMVRTGAGTPLASGRAARASGCPLAVVLPTRIGVPALPPRRDRMAAGELLTLADEVRLLTYDPVDRDSCIGADERLVASSGLLLAVWDGSPSNGRDATAHLVTYARARGVPVEIVWPAGAAREAPSALRAEG